MSARRSDTRHGLDGGGVMHSFALVGLLLVPLVGSLIVFGLPQRDGALIKRVTLLVTLVDVVYIIVLGAAFDTSAGAPRFQFAGSWTWIESIRRQPLVRRRRHRSRSRRHGGRARPGGGAGVLELLRQPVGRRGAQRQAAQRPDVSSGWCCCSSSS